MSGWPLAFTIVGVAWALVAALAILMMYFMPRGMIKLVEKMNEIDSKEKTNEA